MKLKPSLFKFIFWSVITCSLSIVPKTLAADPIGLPSFPNAPQAGSTSAVSSYPFTVADSILNLLIYIGFPLSVISILYSSYSLITSNGNPDAFVKAKKNLGYLIIGFLLISVSTSLVIWVRNIFGGI